jgi:chromosomal replication initiation ATPase DnaA
MPTLGNERLGIVEEGVRRREAYARYIEKRVAAVLKSPVTKRQIEAEVAERVRREVRRRVAERAARRLAELRLTLPGEGPLIGDILKAVARATATAASVAELVAPRPTAALAPARDVAILLLGELRPELLTAQIARVCGGCDEAAILEARARAAERIADPASDSARWYAEARALLLPQEG